MTAVAISNTVEIWKADMDDAPVVVVPVVAQAVTSDAECTEDGKRAKIPRKREKAWRVLGVRKGRGDVAGWTERERERAPCCMRCIYTRAAAKARRLATAKAVQGSSCCPDVCVDLYCPGAYVNWKGNITPLQFACKEQYGVCVEQHSSCDWLGEGGEEENGIGEGEGTEI